MFITFRRRKEGGGVRERDGRQCERETLIACLPYVPGLGMNPQHRSVPWPGIEPAAFLVYGMMLQPTEPPHRTNKKRSIDEQ